MTKYATKEQVQAVAVAVDDVTVDGLTYQIEAITRGQFRWARDEVGYRDNPVTGKEEVKDPDAVDMLMLAICLTEPAFDEHDEDDIRTLNGLPLGVSSKLISKILDLSGLNEEDPTSQTDE